MGRRSSSMTVVATILFLLQIAAAPAAQTGTITGQVRSANGAPATEVRVAAIPVSVENPRAGDSPTLVSIAQTDSEGRYRLEKVPPGDYYVMAGLSGSSHLLSRRHAARRRGRRAGDCRRSTQGVDFALVRSAGVTRERASGSGRRQHNDPATALHECQGSSGAYTPFDVEAAPDGSFAFPRVPPGNYTISAVSRIPGGQPIPITVGEMDLAGLEFFVPRSSGSIRPDRHQCRQCHQ